MSFITNSNFPIPIILNPGGVNLWYFKLCLVDLTKFLVWNIWAITESGWKDKAVETGTSDRTLMGLV